MRRRGSSGLIGMCAAALLTAIGAIVGTAFAFAQAAAVIGAMTFNFALNNRFTYRDRQLKDLAWLGGLFSFYLVCSLGAVANVGIGSLVYEQYHGWWIAGIAGAIVGSVWNYVASGWLTWSRRSRRVRCRWASRSRRGSRRTSRLWATA